MSVDPYDAERELRDEPPIAGGETVAAVPLDDARERLVHGDPEEWSEEFREAVAPQVNAAKRAAERANKTVATARAALSEDLTEVDR